MTTTYPEAGSRIGSRVGSSPRHGSRVPSGRNAAPVGLADVIARLAVAPNSSAWEHLLTLAGNDVARVTRQYAGRDNSFEDAMQETLLQVRKDAHQFRVTGTDADSSARRWIIRIAVNTSLDLLRSRKRAAARDRKAGQQQSDDRDPDSQPPLNALVRGEANDRLHSALAALPEAKRTPVEMRYIRGHGYETIAAHLGVPEATVRTRVNRGLMALRERLKRFAR
ncbi:MAG: RNA polymerase sigma factor [Planctomycetes bacterium]|nr:RNA polymerase sigma factor [Planctomycetota bacterium]